MPLPDTTAWLIVLWLFIIGGVVGSFLNVVVYRLPLGLSLVHPPSHCPKCGEPIRWYDNVPIFGWLMLRGRCRQCHHPISARYPVVEAITAVMFATVALAAMPPICKLQLFAVCPYHLLLLCTLLCAGLIEYDGNRPPLSLFVPTLIAGVAMQLLWPALRPVAAGWWGLPSSWAAPVDVLAGLMLGGVFWWALRNQNSTALALSLVCVAVFLGWQALCVLTIATVAIHLVLYVLRKVWPKLCVPLSMTVGVLALAWILV